MATKSFRKKQRKGEYSEGQWAYAILACLLNKHENRAALAEIYEEAQKLLDSMPDDMLDYADRRGKLTLNKKRLKQFDGQETAAANA